MALRNFADQPPGHRQLTFPLVDHQGPAQPNHDDHQDYHHDQEDEDQSYSYRRRRTTGVGNETDPGLGLAALLEDRYETIQHTLVCLGIGCYLNLAVTLAALL